MISWVFSRCEMSAELRKERGIGNGGLTRLVFENQTRRVGRIVEEMERIEQGPVERKQIAERAAKSPTDIGGRDVMPATLDTIADAQQGEAVIGNPEVEHLQPKTGLLDSAQ